MAKKYKCRVEYLESTGTQYIDSGVYPTQLTEAEYRCAVTGSVANNDSHLFGSRLSASSEAFDLAYMNTSANGIEKFRFIHGTTTTQETTTSVTASQLANPHTYYMSGTSFKVDGSEKMSFTTASFTGSYSLWLFGVNSAGSLHNQVRAQRVYKCKIWDNGTLVRDYIPVLDNSGRPAMYDQVSGQLFYNQGTGEFTYGRQIIPVEYLESTGTQYIDTGLKGKNGYDFDYKFNSTRIDGTAYGIGGEWENGKSCYLGLIRDTNYFGYHYQNTSSAVQVQLLTANTDYRVQAHLYSGEQYYILNGTKSAVGTITGTFTSTSNMRLFSIYSSTPLYSYIKMYYCKIYDNGVLVRDFIPCIDENLTPFMFDKVNNTVYLNAGTGQFKVGPNVEKVWGGKKLRRKLALAIANLKKKRRYYCEVEYLKSDGLSLMYITPDLSYFPDFEVGVKCDSNSDRNATLGVDGNNMLERSSASKPYWTLHASGTIFVSNVGVGTYADTKYKDGVFSVNGVTVGTKENTFQSGTLCLFKPQTGNNNPYKMSIYFFKAWDSSGNLVRDLIPVLDWNMTPCMYDKVSGQLFYNKGTGSFSVGRQIHPVEYLESTGTQYILTGFTPTVNTDFELELSSTKTSTNWAMGCPTWIGVHYKGANGQVGVTNSSTSEFQQYVNYARDNTRITMKLQGNTVYANGVSLGTITRRAGTLDFALFGYRDANRGATLLFTGSIYKCIIWDNGVPVRDFIPAIDENGVGYMFDRVSHTIYDNAGTGQFSYPAREVEYLESTGTQYIDTGFKPIPATTKLEFMFTPTSTPSNKFLFGARPDTSAGSYTCTAYCSSALVRRDWAGVSTYFTLQLNTTDKFLYTAYNNTVSLNNETYTGTVTRSTTRSDYNFMLFAVNTGGTIDNRMLQAKLYYSKLWDNGTLVRDFIPTYKDGSLGMWDKANNVFYPNAGTGTFTTGKIVEPEYE